MIWEVVLMVSSVYSKCILFLLAKLQQVPVNRNPSQVYFSGLAYSKSKVFAGYVRKGRILLGEILVHY